MTQQQPFDLARVSPKRMARLLDEAQWKPVMGRGGLYVRYRPPEELATGGLASVVVPLDTAAPDYAELMTQALTALRDVPGDGPDSALLPRLLASPTDEFSFEKDTLAPRGWIEWDDGMSLYEAARALLASGAKSAREHRKYFGNKYGQFANRFLGEVMMGQTAIASYVVRAYVPSDAQVPVKNTPEENVQHFPGVDVVLGRTVSEEVVRTLQAAEEAVQHYRSSQSFSAFTAPDSPLAYESVVALKQIAQDAQESAIHISWEPSSSSTEQHAWEFTFTPDTASVFEKAATTLVKPEPQRRVTAMGTVHLLSRAEAGAPGVVGITTADGEPANKVRVRLESDDYHRAITAHDEGRAISVSGDLEREGNLAWLYRAALTEVGDERVATTEAPNGDDEGTLF